MVERPPVETPKSVAKRLLTQGATKQDVLDLYAQAKDPDRWQWMLDVAKNM